MTTNAYLTVDARTSLTVINIKSSKNSKQSVIIIRYVYKIMKTVKNDLPLINGWRKTVNKLILVM